MACTGSRMNGSDTGVECLVRIGDEVSLGNEHGTCCSTVFLPCVGSSPD